MALHIISISLQKLRGYFSHRAFISNPITFLLPAAATTLLPFSFSSDKHPNLLSFLCLDLPCRLHEFCSHFLTPPFLFLLLNFVIISIAVTSPAQDAKERGDDGEVVRKDEEEANVNDEERDDDDDDEGSRSCKKELSSSLQQVEILNVKALPLPPASHLSNLDHSKDETLKRKAQALPLPPAPLHLSNHDHNKDKTLKIKAQALPLPPAPVHLSNHDHNKDKTLKIKALPLPPPPPPYLFNHDHCKGKTLNVNALPLPPPLPPALALHSLSKPSLNNRCLQKSATWNLSHSSPRPVDLPGVQKSKTFHAHHDPNRSSSSSVGDEDTTMSLDELNMKIEAFIAKINNRMRLQSKID